MNGFKTEEHIAKPPREVFAVLSDPTVGSEFIDTITECVKVTDGPIGVGTVFRETRVIRGKEGSADLQVVAHEPDTFFSITSEAEGFTVVYCYRLTPDSDGTLVTWTCEVLASGMRRMMIPVVVGMMKKEDGDHLQTLKGYLEGR